jgi:hypothetical protein
LGKDKDFILIGVRMNLVEKLESWRWIKPIPSKLPKKSETRSQSQSSDKKNSNKKPFSSFASHLQEWQKEQKYNYSKSSGFKFSAISHGIAKSARKFKSELDKIKSKTIFSRTDKFRETGVDVEPAPKVTLLYQSNSNKRNQKFVRLDEEIDENVENDSEDFYLVPKTPKLVTFAESTSSISTNSVSSFSENQWLWLVFYHICRRNFQISFFCKIKNIKIAVKAQNKVAKNKVIKYFFTSQ